MSDKLVIGIDLGSTNYCVSVFLDGKTKILKSSEGDRVTPSFIYFSETETLIGKRAKELTSTDRLKGIYGVKRLIGCQYNDWVLESYLKNLLYHITKNKNGDIVIKVTPNDKVVAYYPQSLYTLILTKIKQDAEEQLGTTCQNAVITVPPYFDAIQRQVTFAAAKKAGFAVFKLLDEPTAAALNYYFETTSESDSYKSRKEVRYALVFDMGGTTLNVTILKKLSNQMEVIQSRYDTQLGGDDFDNIIVTYVCNELRQTYGYSPKQEKIKTHLKQKCEDAKIALSVVNESRIILYDFVKDFPSVQITVTRETFDDLSDGLCQKAMKVVDSCLEYSKLSKKLIKDVIIAGGATHTPKLQTLLSKYFNGKNINTSINPAECVAAGAAIQAAMLSVHRKQKISKIILRDVVPLSLGVLTFGEQMHVMIRRNSPIPVRVRETFTAVYDEQGYMTFKLFEGERADVQKNYYLGTLTIDRLARTTPGDCHVIITMHINERGTLNVYAEGYRKRSQCKQLQVNYEYVRGGRSTFEINRNIEDAKNHETDDKVFRNLARHKSHLIAYCTAFVYHLEKSGLAKDNIKIFYYCNHIEKLPALENATNLEDVKKILQDVRDKCEPLVTKHGFQMPILNIDVL